MLAILRSEKRAKVPEILKQFSCEIFAMLQIYTGNLFGFENCWLCSVESCVAACRELLST
jgi:hypothetical protein